MNLDSDDDQIADLDAEVDADILDNDAGDVTPEDDEDGETIITFGDADDPEPEPETPLIKQLRQQVRELSKRVKHAPAEVDDDPEPVIPPRKKLEDFDYIQEELDAYDEAREKVILATADWKVRQAERERSRQAQQDAQAQAIETQRRALNVPDYEASSQKVRDRLTDTQIGIIINGTDNPAAVIYALGKSETRLDQIAGEGNMAKFAVMLGKLEKDMKVMKRKPAAPESRVTGATASASISSDKELARLEKEAEKTGDRTKVVAYKRRMRQAA